MSEVPADSKPTNKHLDRLSSFGIALGGIALFAIFIAFWTALFVLFLNLEAGWPSNGWEVVLTVTKIATAVDIVIVFTVASLFFYGSLVREGLTAFLDYYAQAAWIQHIICFKLFSYM